MSIKLEKICKRFGDKVVFDGLDVSFESGATYAITAPSGFGKTTLLKLMCGLIRPDSGEIHGVGKFSIMFQDPRLFPSLSLIDNLVQISGASRNDALKIADKLGLSGALTLKPDELSVGMKSRANLASALLYVDVTSAQTILLDEPFASLDDASTELAAKAILDCASSPARTVFVVCHGGRDRFLGARVDVALDAPKSAYRLDF